MKRCRREELNSRPLPYQDSASHLFPISSRSMPFFSPLQRASEGLKLCTCTETSCFPLHRLDCGAQVIGVVVSVHPFERVEAHPEEAYRRPFVGAAPHGLRHSGVPQVVAGAMVDADAASAVRHAVFRLPTRCPSTSTT